MRKNTSILVLLFIFIIGTVLSGCNSGEGEVKTDQKQLSVYTTIYPVQFLLEEIGGDTVAVTSVYPPGVDAHTYEPTTRDMTAIATSDAFIYFGEGMEAFTESAANALASEPVKLISLGEHSELFHGAEENHAHHDHDHDHDADHDANADHDHDDHDAHHDHDHAAHEDEEAHESEGQKDSEIVINGAIPHYHSGDSVQLTAEYKGESDGDWQWFTMQPGETDWEDAGSVTNQFEGEATINGEQIKAARIDESGEIIAESMPIMIEIDDHDGDNDPHVWIDPQRMKLMADIIKDELIALNPDGEKQYNQNYEKLVEQLQKLDESYVNTIEGKDNKYIIVPHAAYGYWEERYGIEQIAVSGLTTTDEPSQKYLTELINKAQQYNLQFVLYEQNTPDKLMEIIQKQIDAKAVTIHNLSVLTEEDMKKDEDYISLMERNLQVLDEVLQ